MAIFHLSTTPISRADGRSVVAAAAYRAAVELTDERTGQVFDYTRKRGVLSSEIVTPEGVPVPERAALWNAAEAAERRKDARVGREWRGAGPAELGERGITIIARRFAKEYADHYGVAVDFAIHAPDPDGDERNWHVHMLATTRKIDAKGELGEKAAIELSNTDRQKFGLGKTQDDMVFWRARWAEITNEELERHGFNDRIDHRSHAERGIDLEPSKHIGVQAVGMDRRGIEVERMAQYEKVRRENALKIEKDPSIVLETITSTRAVFDRRDMARELHRYIDDPEQFQNILARLEQDKQLVQLAPERTEGMRTIPAKYSTREMINTEQRMVDTASRMSWDNTHGVDTHHVQNAIDRRGSLSDEQRRAVEHVTGVGRLAVVIGDAGTGKSFAMATAREAWEAQGFRVRGAALAGKAADELQAGSGIDSRTIASLEHAWKEGRDQLTSRDVLVIDEAGMVGSRQLGRVLERADKAGAKVVLVGDDKQLAAIEAGAGFRAITERTGATEITEIRRQREVWAREASAEFARGDVRAALDAYSSRGGVRMVESREDAKTAMAADYLADRQLGGSAIILAHSNKDVAGLNQAIRTARVEAGELGPATDFETSRGKREFAQGDRLLFLRNDRNLDVKNGTLGTVREVEEGRLSVSLDDGREVGFAAKDYEHIDHGYAVTVHKAQGVTVDRAYLLATPGMGRSLAYVGMTRHRDAATLYAGDDDFAGYDKLAKNLARERPKETTLDFARRHGVEVNEGASSVTRLEAQATEVSAEQTKQAFASSTATMHSEPARQARSPLQEKQQAEMQKTLAKLREQRESAGSGSSKAKMDEAVRIMVAHSERKSISAGAPFDAQQAEKRAAEGLQRNPHQVDMVLKMEAVRIKAAENAAGQEQPDQSASSQRSASAQKFDFEKLRTENQRIKHKKDREQDRGQEQGGPER